ncbi:MAG: hypoxanthine phosphoribosyltransferase, partial [Bacteroidales bacterium]|nr:hypoxanthine phosphoribosyltransferase [Bacteroidales bacterium]
MDKIKVHDKFFKVFITEEMIASRIDELSKQINDDLAGKDLLFIGVLNGSFLFAADLFRRIDMDARISFLKLSSYEGTVSTGFVRRLIGLNESVMGKTVIVIEDIVDTGKTLEGIINDLRDKEVEEIRVATLLLKPEAYKGDYKVDYVGFEIPN